MAAGTNKCLEDLKPKSCLGFRHVQLAFLILAMMLAYAMRVNMSMAIVSMTDHDKEDAFDWSVQTQSVILSSFFWGYIVFQVPGGELAAKIGGKKLLVGSLGINSLVTLLVPFCAYYGGWQLVCACRVIQGLSQGATIPSINCLIANWAPLDEKSRFASMIYAGSQLGTALQLLAAGFIADYWGWPAIFYVVGIIGAVWTVLYVILGSSSPQESKIVGDKERLYIQTSLGHVGGQKKYKTPWKAVWTSLPFISLVVVHCGQNWGFWTLMTETPTYMNQVLGVDIKANGVMSAIPYLAMYLLSVVFGWFSDYILMKKWLSTSGTRKLFNSIGHFGPAIALLALSYAPNDVIIAVLILTVVVSLNAGHCCGFMLVHIDMAPNFAGTLIGITNGSANVISIIAPIVAGAMLKDETNADEWQNVFYLASAIYIAGNLIFLIFGTSERQEWNEPIKYATQTEDNEESTSTTTATTTEKVV